MEIRTVGLSWRIVSLVLLWVTLAHWTSRCFYYPRMIDDRLLTWISQNDLKAAWIMWGICIVVGIVIAMIGLAVAGPPPIFSS